MAIPDGDQRKHSDQHCNVDHPLHYAAILYGFFEIQSQVKKYINQENDIAPCDDAVYSA